MSDVSDVWNKIWMWKKLLKFGTQLNKCLPCTYFWNKFANYGTDITNMTRFHFSRFIRVAYGPNSQAQTTTYGRTLFQLGYFWWDVLSLVFIVGTYPKGLPLFVLDSEQLNGTSLLSIYPSHHIPPRHRQRWWRVIHPTLELAKNHEIFTELLAPGYVWIN